MTRKYSRNIFLPSQPITAIGCRQQMVPDSFMVWSISQTKTNYWVLNIKLILSSGRKSDWNWSWSSGFGFFWGEGMNIEEKYVFGMTGKLLFEGGDVHLFICTMPFLNCSQFYSVNPVWLWGINYLIHNFIPGWMGSKAWPGNYIRGDVYVVFVHYEMIFFLAPQATVSPLNLQITLGPI